MSFNVSTITAFTNETAQRLIKSAVLTGSTIDMVSIIPGIKYKETINILDNTITVADGACGWSSAGSVAFSQREIEVVDLQVQESLCEKTLEQYFMGQWMKAGSPQDEQIGAILGESYVEKIKEYNELGIWKGGTYSFGTTASYSNKLTGFVSILGGESTRVTATTSTAPTSSTIIAIIDAMVNAIPEDILDKPDLTLFLPYSFYMLYTNALRTANLYQMNVGENGNYETYVPGTNVKVKATKGLTGTGWMVLTFASNLVIGTDLMNEEEAFQIWFSQDNQEVRVNITWKLGCQVKFPAHCVCNF